jgi:D-threo-aldose 1-dehydrogenase
VRVTEMGLGTAQLGDLYAAVEPDDAVAIVDVAWNNGIRYFDTAPHYGLGLAERRLGRALRHRRRDEYALSTKVGRIIEGDGDSAHRRWDFTADGVRRSVAESRQRLGLERIDIAFVHDPDERPEEALALAVPELVRMREAGELGAIGVGTKDVPTLLRFVRESDVDVVMVAGRTTLLDHSALDELIPECADRGISVIGAGVFNSGVLASEIPDPTSHYEYAAPSAEVIERTRALADIAARHGFTLPEAAVAFARRPSPPVVSVVVGADSAEQMERNAALLDSAGDVDGLIADVRGRR